MGLKQKDKVAQVEALNLLPKLLGIAAMFALYEISPLKGAFGRLW